MMTVSGSSVEGSIAEQLQGKQHWCLVAGRLLSDQHCGLEVKLAVEGLRS